MFNKSDPDIAWRRDLYSSVGKTSSDFVFPSGRSRARPKLVPHLGTFSGRTGSVEGEEKRTGFMGKLLKKIKASKSVEELDAISIGSSVEAGPTQEAVIPANRNKYVSMIFVTPTPVTHALPLPCSVIRYHFE